MRGGVFINYRSADSQSYGALLYAGLSREFGTALVFRDADSIPAGADYTEHLLGRVRRAHVLLAVIGEHWFAAHVDGARAIDDPTDWIRRELVEAFSVGVPVIPVLTDRADMPSAECLPEDLRPLAHCQYRRLRHRDASADIARLADDLAEMDPCLEAARRAGPYPRRPAGQDAARTRPIGRPEAWLVPTTLVSAVTAAVLASVGHSERGLRVSGWFLTALFVFAVLAGALASRFVWARRAMESATQPPGMRQAGRAELASLRPPAIKLSTIRGRHEELALLRNLLDHPEGRIAVVCGIGGAGKTTIAAALAAEAEAKGRAVFWMRWRDRDLLADQMGAVAVACGLSGQQLTDPHASHRSLPDLVWRQLDRKKGWLLVLDNLDNPAALNFAGDLMRDYRGWVRPSHSGLILITSRDRDLGTWGDRAILVPVGPLDDTSGGQVLADMAPNAGGIADAAKLAARLGGLPLALHAAGAYLSRPTAEVRGFDGYQQMLTTRFGDLLGAKDPTATDPEAARRLVRYTWELSLDQLANEGRPHARTVLELLCQLAEAPIPRALVTSALLQAVDSHDANAQRIDGALAGLYSYGLVEAPATDRLHSLPTLTLHPLVRETIAHSLTTTDKIPVARYRNVLRDRLVEMATETVRAGRAGWPIARLLAPHLPLLIAPDVNGEEFPTRQHLLDSVADLLEPAGHHADLLALRQAMLAAQDSLLGPDHPAALAERHKLGVALHDIARYREALAVHTAVLEARLRVLGPDDLDTLRSRNGVAQALTRQGRMKEAIQVFENSLDRHTLLFGQEHLDILASHHMIAFALCWLGRYQEAIDTLHYVIECRTRHLGAYHPDTLRARNTAGIALAGLEKYDEIVELYRELLDQTQLIFGPDHPDIFASRNNLGWALNKIGRHIEAADIHRQLLQLRDDLGEDHPHVLKSMNNLAEALNALGNYDEAADIHRQVLELRTRVLGPDHLHTLLSRHNLAESLAGMGRTDEAIPLLIQVLQERKQLLGPTHPDTQLSQNMLATAIDNLPPGKHRRKRNSG